MNRLQRIGTKSTLVAFLSISTISSGCNQNEKLLEAKIVDKYPYIKLGSGCPDPWEGTMHWHACYEIVVPKDYKLSDIARDLTEVITAPWRNIDNYGGWEDYMINKKITEDELYEENKNTIPKDRKLKEGMKLRYLQEIPVSGVSINF